MGELAGAARPVSNVFCCAAIVLDPSSIVKIELRGRKYLDGLPPPTRRSPFLVAVPQSVQ
jgi:hypothetical protein